MILEQTTESTQMNMNCHLWPIMYPLLVWADHQYSPPSHPLALRIDARYEEA